jgi:hypothetical protein
MNTKHDICKTAFFTQNLRLPFGMRSLYLWGQAQKNPRYIPVLKIIAFLALETG